MVEKKYNLFEYWWITLFPTDPPKVTGLQVNGRETNATLVVDENQMLRVSCTFENGNPPVSFLIREKTSHRHNSTKQEEGPLVISLEGSHCHDIWPVITCEAPGSELNRSVAILVKCEYRSK